MRRSIPFHCHPNVSLASGPTHHLDGPQPDLAGLGPAQPAIHPGGVPAGAAGSGMGAADAAAALVRQAARRGLPGHAGLQQRRVIIAIFHSFKFQLIRIFNL